MNSTNRATSQQRDMTKREFVAALKRRGFSFDVGPMSGYVICPSGVHVYRHNAGPRLRDQLAYLIAEDAKWKSLSAATGGHHAE